MKKFNQIMIDPKELYGKRVLVTVSDRTSNIVGAEYTIDGGIGRTL